MIKQLSITGFKSLSSVELDLGVVNVFIGPNGAGKSNLLEAIALLGAAANGRVEQESLAYRGVRARIGTTYHSSFLKSNGFGPVQVKVITDDNVSYEVAITPPSIEYDSSWEFDHERLFVPDSTDIARDHNSPPRLDSQKGYLALRSIELPGNSPGAKLLSDLTDYAIYDPNTPCLRGIAADPSSRRPVGLAGGLMGQALFELRDQPEFKDILAYVQSIASWVKEVRAAYPNGEFGSSAPPSVIFFDTFMDSVFGRMSSQDVSEGVLYVLFGGILALHPKAPKLLAIDNIDHALNPRLSRSYARQLSEWYLKQTDRQVLLTTHNPAFLDGLPLADDRVRLFTLDRTLVGETVVRRVRVTQAILDAAEVGTTLGQSWVTGAFGGVPAID